MRTSSAFAAALLASSTVAPVLAHPINVQAAEARAISSATAAQGATLGLAAVTLLKKLFGKRHMDPTAALKAAMLENEIQMAHVDARGFKLPSLGGVANGATIGLAGLSALPFLGSLFGGDKRELSEDDVASINALLTHDVEARAFKLPSLGGIANGATIGLAGLSALPFIGSLFGGDKRELNSDDIASINAMLSSNADTDVEARAFKLPSLGSVANGATIGLAGLSALPFLGSLFGGDKRELSEDDVASINALLTHDVEARAFKLPSLGGIANGATIGLAGLSALPLIGSLFGGDKRELTADDVASINAMLSSNADTSVEARAFKLPSLSGVANGATVGLAGLTALPFISSLFGGDKRELSEEDVASLNALLTHDVEARAFKLPSLGGIANGATIGLAGLSALPFIGSLFGGDKREMTPEDISSVNAMLADGAFLGSDVEARAFKLPSLTNIASGATIGAAALSSIPLFGKLFGGDKRELNDDDVAAINALLTHDFEARAFKPPSLGGAANGATIGLAGLSAFPLLSSLFGGEKRELEEMDARAFKLGTAANVASVGLALNNIFGQLFGRDIDSVMADLD